MAVKILVVDADPTVQRALGNALTQAGYRGHRLERGPGGAPSGALRRPALVLVAANLPGIDGFTVVSRLRMEDGPSTHTPVILLLAENEAEARGKALRSGADDYLIKPFHPAELMARMRSLLARFQPAEPLAPPTPRPGAAAAPAAPEEARARSSHPVLRRQGRRRHHDDRHQRGHRAPQGAGPARLPDRRQSAVRRPSRLPGPGPRSTERGGPGDRTRGRPGPDPPDPRQARVRDRVAAGAAVAGDGRTRDQRPPAGDHGPAGQRVRLHRPRRRQAPRRGQPAAHGRGPRRSTSS